MHEYLELPGLGKATSCEGSSSHSPDPVRFIWHHILPEVCGGSHDLSNLIQLCDNCHITIHGILWVLRRDNSLKAIGRHSNELLRLIAIRGYREALAAGTEHLIPNEGSIWS